ncbi:uncharacterized protein SPAPADRAFT_61345 [Spathaspora passalidarum NRRL Y-27907]|uniref:Uncharacterized protein n=1 Tax=Spathaspora passalidarum (strain NRRL Y-27907 / 11-Y1) TaxID=619300 RepID=G3APU2_SPAPN|nr:uncharacterized protein SPAPADRAFT_61345 [Spathaspora passalidarum NRRL Y-27907]EGW32263.1 hypothetical protein SPAPADRAFT_61345 [Spathaspora passalidarum NRRL Y-27907]
MEKNNPLLPFAFTSSVINDINPLNTTPRARTVIDENASSRYHTRTTHLVTPESDRRVPLGDRIVPSLKRKLTSFNERDDIKRADIELPTEIDDHEELPPSSPPVEIPLMSEFDFSTTTHAVPESPKHIHNLPSEPDVILPHRNISSDADFGIDRFNRFKVSFNDLPSSNADDEYKDTGFNKARSVILEAFESIETVINLQSMNLHDLPNEIKDLNNLVIFDTASPSYELYLSHNKLTTLPPSLFKFTKLNVLVLRHNKISRIPPLIEKLTNLTDLTLSTNKISWLPYQLLHLPKLQTFSAGPNPLMRIPEDDAIECNYTLSTHECHHRTSINYLSPHKSKVPSLKSLCLDKIANYDITYKETRIWKQQTPKVFHTLMAKAIAQGKQRDTCNQCSLIVVEPVAEVFEWWDILENRNIPIRKQFCCQGCVDRYLNSLD